MYSVNFFILEAVRLTLTIKEIVERKSACMNLDINIQL